MKKIRARSLKDINNLKIIKSGEFKVLTCHLSIKMFENIALHKKCFMLINNFIFLFKNNFLGLGHEFYKNA